MSTFFCPEALLPTGLARDVTVVTAGGRITSLTAGSAPPTDAVRLAGTVVPGFANAHSHAFHRALRGDRPDGGTFWTWRARMYDVAGRLDPDTYYALARATYAEMVLAGFTAVGEFHYLHHQPDGTPYADPNAMSAALIAAAAEAGIRITLLDTCYLTGGINAPVAGVQHRFADADVDAWAARATAFRPEGSHARTGAAIHSVRAAAPADMAAVAGSGIGPVHVHLSEQRGENDACRAAYGVSPTQLLADSGALGPHTTAVHAVHLADADVALLAGAGASVCCCPSTERALADGLAPATELDRAGITISLGTDAHASIDPFLEMRGLEYGERLRRERRGNFGTQALLAAATAAGHAALGWPDAGEITVGAIADLVAISGAGVRRSGASGMDGLVFTATAADVTDVVASGRVVVRDSRHLLVDDVPGALVAAIAVVRR
ncbi:MAG: formimidoylglutamate deiminase [Mycobacteriales bacterium]